MGGVKLGITGEEAKKYIKQNQSVAAWLLYDAGGAKFSRLQISALKDQANSTFFVRSFVRLFRGGLFYFSF